MHDLDWHCFYFLPWLIASFTIQLIIPINLIAIISIISILLGINFYRNLRVEQLRLRDLPEAIVYQIPIDSGKTHVNIHERIIFYYKSFDKLILNPSNKYMQKTLSKNHLFCSQKLSSKTL